MPEISADFERYPLFQQTLRQLDETPIPYRTMRTEMVNCATDAEYLAKLHFKLFTIEQFYPSVSNYLSNYFSPIFFTILGIRLSFQLLFKVC